MIGSFTGTVLRLYAQTIPSSGGTSVANGLASVDQLAAPSTPPVKCDAYNAVDPIARFFTAEILGLKGLVTYVVIIALIGLLFVAGTRHMNKVVRVLVYIVAILALGGIITTILPRLLGNTC